MMSLNILRLKSGWKDFVRLSNLLVVYVSIFWRMRKLEKFIVLSVIRVFIRVLFFIKCS